MVSRYGMNTSAVAIPLQYAAIARNRKALAAVEMNRFTCTFSTLLFTNPVYSHVVRIVISVNSAIIATGVSMPTTIVATKNTPVMALTMKFFSLSLIVLVIWSYLFSVSENVSDLYLSCLQINQSFCAYCYDFS